MSVLKKVLGVAAAGVVVVGGVSAIQCADTALLKKRLAEIVESGRKAGLTDEQIEQQLNDAQLTWGLGSFAGMAEALLALGVGALGGIIIGAIFE